MRKNLTIVVGLLVSAGFLYWAFKDASIEAVWLHIRGLNIYFLAAGLVFVLAEMLLRAVRWKLLFAPAQGPKIPQLFSVLMIGYFSNNVIPLRMGELVRAQFLGSNYNVSRARALATIVVERVCDVLMLLVFFGLCFLVFDIFPSWVKRGAVLAGLAFLAGLGGLYFYIRNGSGLADLLLRWAKNSRLSQTLASIMVNFSSGLAALGDLRNLTAALALSVVIWLMVMGLISMVLSAFALEISYFAPLFIAVMLGLGMLIPSSPGNLGVYEGAVILALIPFGVEKEAALSFSLVLHGFELVFTTLVGFVCFMREVGSLGAAAARLRASATVSGEQ